MPDSHIGYQYTKWILCYYRLTLCGFQVLIAKCFSQRDALTFNRIFDQYVFLLYTNKPLPWMFSLMIYKLDGLKWQAFDVFFFLHSGKITQSSWTVTSLCCWPWWLSLCMLLQLRPWTWPVSNHSNINPA